MADIMASEGYLAAGYRVLALDDCWQSARNATGGIIPDPSVSTPHGTSTTSSSSTTTHARAHAPTHAPAIVFVSWRHAACSPWRASSS